MTNFFTRLAARTLGLTSVVQPLMTSMFAPDSIMPSDYSLGFEIKFDSLDTNVLMEETFYPSLTLPLSRGGKEISDFPPLQGREKDISDFPPLQEREKDISDFPPLQEREKDISDFPPLQEREKDISNFPPLQGGIKGGNTTSVYTVANNEGELAELNLLVQQGIAATPVQQNPQNSIEQGNEIQRFAANPAVNFEQQNRQTQTPANSSFVQPPVSGNRQIETNMRSPNLIANNTPINSNISNPFVQQGIAATPVQQNPQNSIEQGNEIQRFAANPAVNFEQQHRQTQTPANSSFVQPSVSENRQVETNMRSPNLIVNNTPINPDTSNPLQVRETKDNVPSTNTQNSSKKYAKNILPNSDLLPTEVLTPVQHYIDNNPSRVEPLIERIFDDRNQMHEISEKSSNKSQNPPTNSISQKPEGEMRSQVSSTTQNPVAARIGHRQSTDANSIVPAQPPASLKLNQDAQNTAISTSHLGHSLVSRLNQRLSAPKLAVIQPIVNTRNANSELRLSQASESGLWQSPTDYKSTGVVSQQEFSLVNQLPSVLPQPSFKGERFNSVVHQNREARQLETTNQSDASTIPTIQITIGRIEVRASTPPASKVPKTKSTQQVAKLGLSDYLKQRDGGKL
jgi:hypothetical protein